MSRDWRFGSCAACRPEQPGHMTAGGNVCKLVSLRILWMLSYQPIDNFSLMKLKICYDTSHPTNALLHIIYYTAVMGDSKW